MGIKREGYPIVGREVELHDTGYRDQYGRRIEYETTVEAIGDLEAPTTPRTWRVWGRSLRDGLPLGRGSAPLHVYTIADARAMVRTLFHRHCRYVERSTAVHAVKAAAAEEDLNALAERKGV